MKEKKLKLPALSVNLVTANYKTNPVPRAHINCGVENHILDSTSAKISKLKHALL